MFHVLFQSLWTDHVVIIPICLTVINSHLLLSLSDDDDDDDDHHHHLYLLINSKLITRK